MSRFTKYKLYQKYETRGSQEAIPCYPNVFSIDGDGTMPLVIVEENSRDCGYTGETQPIYRWYTLPIDTYYYCDACQDAQYKWVNLPIAEDWECVGTTKYYKQKKMVSVDGGSTWTDVTPPQYQRGALYEYSSQSCGYRTRTSSGSPYCTGYDKYVDVYSQYSTDGGNTWQTTATTPTLVEHNSAYCGYIEPQYRTTSGTPYCSGYDKYVDVYNQVSYDGGSTWQTTATTSTLVERDSSDCGYEIKYRTTTGSPYCSGTDKYVDVYSQVSYDMGSTWETTATTPTMIEHNSYDCGYEVKYRTTSGTSYCDGYSKYVPVYSQVSYDMGTTWETTATTNVLVESYSQDCGYVPLTRWVESGWTCVDYSKYVNNVQQISYDNGQTWENTSSTSASTLIEQYSYDCMGGVKLLSINDYGGITATPCNSTAALISSDVPIGYSTYIIGQCVTVINGSTGGSGTGGLYGKNFVQCRIPNTVTAIGIGAFSRCTSLSSLTIPSSVTEISSAMCSGCTAMESVSLPNTITEIKTHAFDSCSSLKSVVIPDSVTTLGSSTFEKCASLTSVTIGSGVTSINGRDFLDCTSLPNIVILDNVTSIQGLAFGVCESLTSVTIGSGVTTIGTDAFSACGLTSLNIPSNVTTIDVGAFNHNVNLTSCTINNGVGTIGSSAFSYCYSLTSINIPNSVTSIGIDAFRSCSGLTDVTIGSGIGYILDSAFINCPSITSVTINATTPPLARSPFDSNSTFPIYVPCDSLTSYRNSTYWWMYGNRIQGIPPCAEPPQYRTISGDPYCEGYDKYVDVYSQVSYNGGYTWQTTATTPTMVEHNSLDCGYIPSNKMIATYRSGESYSAFCDSSTELTTGDTQPSNYTFESMTDAVIGDCVTEIGEKAFYNGNYPSLSSVTIGSGVTVIGNEAFRICNKLSSVTIPDSVTTIGNGAFSNCSGLTSVTIGSGVTSIGGGVFGYCYGLTSVTIPDSVTSIGTQAFNVCSGLTSVTIGSGVTSISDYAFWMCGSINSMTIHAPTPPTIGTYVFGLGTNYPIYVPAASVNAYKSASGWSDYASRIQAIP